MKFDLKEKEVHAIFQDYSGNQIKMNYQLILEEFVPFFDADKSQVL